MEVETADLPLPIRAKLLGSEIKEGVLIEKATDVPPHIALGFRSLKSNGDYRYVWLLKGVAQPIAEDYSTKKDSVDHKTPRVKFTFMARVHNGQWKQTADEDGEDFTGGKSWFKRVPGDTSPVVVVDKSALIAAIGEAEELLNSAEIGTGIGEYPEEAYGIFSSAVDAAQGVADDGDAGQDEVDEALGLLEAAVSAFEAARITV